MLTDATKDAVKNIVGKLTDNDESFTAFDVTHVVRRTVDGSAPHHEVKDIVHGMFGKNALPSDYVRTSQSLGIDGKIVNAFGKTQQNMTLNGFRTRMETLLIVAANVFFLPLHRL